MESKSILLQLDLSGKIIGINKSGFPNFWEVNSLVVRYLDEASQVRFLDLLKDGNEQGFALATDFTILYSDQPFVTTLLLIKKNDDFLLMNINESQATLSVLKEVMAINNELTNEIRKHYQQVKLDFDYQSYLQEVSKLNSELINYQRALTQKNKELERVNALLENLSLMDELTQVGNRRKFFKDANALTFLEPHLLVMLDFNYFKQVNDNKGHEYGDFVLKAFAGHLKQILTSYHGEIYRLGGDEFAILVPLRSGFRYEKYALDINAKLHEFYPNVSVAFAEDVISQERLKTTSFEKMMSEIDAKMYENKFNDKNKREKK